MCCNHLLPTKLLVHFSLSLTRQGLYVYIYQQTNPTSLVALGLRAGLLLGKAKARDGAFNYLQLI